MDDIEFLGDELGFIPVYSVEKGAGTVNTMLAGKTFFINLESRGLQLEEYLVLINTKKILCSS
jgi:hypothetical protein